MLRLLSLSPTVWIGVAAAAAMAIAAIVGYGAYREYKGGLKANLKVRERDARRVEKVRRMNHALDQETLQEDAKLIQRLQEADKKWLAPKPQDTPPSASQPAPQQ